MYTFTIHVHMIYIYSQINKSTQISLKGIKSKTKNIKAELLVGVANWMPRLLVQHQVYSQHVCSNQILYE